MNTEIQVEIEVESTQKLKNVADTCSNDKGVRTRSTLRRNATEKATQNKSISKSPSSPVSRPDPSTPSTFKGTLETPRRSVRKSVRPIRDYDDIIENHLPRSASKVKEMNALETQSAQSQKWSASQVGRHSRKRTRKSKRTASKQSQANAEDKKNYNVNETENELLNNKLMEEIATVETISDSSNTTHTAKTCLKMELIQNIDLKDLGLSQLSAEDTIVETEDKTFENEDHDEMPSLILTENGDLADQINYPSAKTLYTEISSAKEQLDNLFSQDDKLNTTFNADARETVNNTNGQGEQVLSLQINTKEEDLLNTTFDAVEQPEDVEMPLLHFSTKATEKVDIKIVLTNAENQDTTILSSKGYRFPTPFKRKPNLAFSGMTTAAINVPGSAGKQKNKILPRRSKSVSELNTIKQKEVTFCSPLEITNVEDIDKRWAGLNDTYVTKRRKRSISLDCKRPKDSKIPLPTRFEPSKIITPNKVQTRKKIPNFAAMHQRSFSKMENIVDHMQRKADRAKKLTNSTLKNNLQTGSSQKSSAKKYPATKNSVISLKRPQAQKKIDMSNMSVLPTPTKLTVEQEEMQRLMKLQRERIRGVTSTVTSKSKIPNPKIMPLKMPLKSSNTNDAKPAFNSLHKANTSASKISKPTYNFLTSLPKSNIPVADSKPAFNFFASMTNSEVSGISKPVVEGPTSAFGGVGNNARKCVDNKLQDRLQRHRDMFKGRQASKREGVENKIQIIRGVRSNRRFELQMQHRRQTEDN